MIKLDETIIRQYSNSPRIQAIIRKFNEAIGTDRYINNFIEMIWDIDTCGTLGLDIWGKIVVVPRYIEVDDDEEYFGFNEANESLLGGYPAPFNQGTFYSGQSTSKIERLTDDAYRKLIKYKALYNISNATIPSINNFLMMIFSDQGRAYAIDNLDMTISLIFEFLPNPVDISIIKYGNVLPRPAGVKILFNFIESPYFGFAEDAYPFNDGTYYIRGQQ